MAEEEQQPHSAGQSAAHDGTHSDEHSVFADRSITKEEWTVVLDYLQNGYVTGQYSGPHKSSVVQAIGKEHFTLLELVPKKEIVLQPHEDVYIGDGKRDKIHHIKGRLPFDQLTATARSEIEPTIIELITKNEARFVEFFNKAQPMTTRMHQLELLPGLGKKHMWEILEVRKEKPFESFDDIRKRVRLMPDPKAIIARRILGELSGKEKHRVFVR